jgi:hypothetical protein
MNDDRPWSQRPSPSILRPGLTAGLVALATILTFFSVILRVSEKNFEGALIYLPCDALDSRDLAYFALVLLAAALPVAWGWRERIRWWDWALGTVVLLIGGAIVARLIYLLFWVGIPVFSSAVPGCLG